MRLTRIASRVQPIGHILKRRQRHKEMLQREKEFKQFIRKEKKKLEQDKKNM